jgi:hypothetical protein
MDIEQLGNPATWDWLSILRTAFGAGLGTAAVQGGISLYKERARKDENAAYLALRIAVLLEAYTSKCCDLYFGNANTQQAPDEQYPSWETELPTPPERLILSVGSAGGRESLPSPVLFRMVHPWAWRNRASAFSRTNSVKGLQRKDRGVRFAARRGSARQAADKPG